MINQKEQGRVLYHGIVLLLVFGLLVFIISKSQKSSPRPPQPKAITQEQKQPIPSDLPKGFRFLKDPKNQFSLAYPTSWKLDEINAKNFVVLNITKDKHTGMQVRVLPQGQLDINEFTNAYINHIQNQMKKHWGGETMLLERKPQTPSVHPGFTTSFSLRRKDNTYWYFRHFLWPHKKHVYILQTGSLKDGQQSFEDQVNQVASTFRLY